MNKPIEFLDDEFERDSAATYAGQRWCRSTTPCASRSSRANAREHFHQLLDALPAAVYTTDAEGRITYYNDAAADLWGHRPALGSAEWCGSWKLYWPDGTPMAHGECPMAVALKEKRPVRGMEAIAERPDGTRVPFLACPTPLYDDAGRLTGGVNMLVDITERKRAEEQQSLLIRELHHRVKNTLATVQAIMGSTARTADTIEDFKTALIGRIGSLAKTHLLLADETRTVSLCRPAAQGTRRLRRRQRRPHRRERTAGRSDRRSSRCRSAWRCTSSPPTPPSSARCRSMAAR